MIRSEADFLQGLRGAIYFGRMGDMSKEDLLNKLDEMVKNRLLIYSGNAEPGFDVTITYREPPKDFKPVKVEGKPISETIIEDRR